MNISDVVAAAARRNPDGPALIDDAGASTWGELDTAVSATAASLLAGPRRGAPVVIALPVGRSVTVALLAVLRAGLVAVPVDPGRSDIDWVVRRVGATTAITDEEVAAATVISRADLRAAGAAGTAPEGGIRAIGGGEDLALLARASRTGPPVMLSHRAVLAAARQLAAAPRMALTPSDRVLQVLPVYHVVGLVTAFLPAALAGAALVLPAADETGSSAPAALAAVRAHRVSVLPAEPNLYRQWDRIPAFDRALATVRLMTSGSSPLDPEDFTAIRAATGQEVREGYGISESAAAVTSTLLVDTPRPGSAGLPYPEIELRIVTGDAAPAADGDTAPAEVDVADPVDDLISPTPAGGEVGRIALRGPTLFSGYWPDGAGGPDADGWFVTGDIGYLDDSGELHLVDRVDGTFQVAGFTVYPREVEDVLAGHPYVADAAVVGVPGRAGTDVVAALVPRPGTRPTSDDLAEFVRGRLAPFKRPVGYQLVDVLPRTEVGRLDRDAVRRHYARTHGIDLREAVEDGDTAPVALADRGRTDDEDLF